MLGLFLQNYKIPTMWDIPREMNVHLLKDSINRHGVLQSKGNHGNPETDIYVSTAVHPVVTAVKSVHLPNMAKYFVATKVPLWMLLSHQRSPHEYGHNLFVNRVAVL